MDKILMIFLAALSFLLFMVSLAINDTLKLTNSIVQHLELSKNYHL